MHTPYDSVWISWSGKFHRLEGSLGFRKAAWKNKAKHSHTIWIGVSLSFSGISSKTQLDWLFFFIFSKSYLIWLDRFHDERNKNSFKFNSLSLLSTCSLFTANENEWIPLILSTKCSPAENVPVFQFLD